MFGKGLMVNEIELLQDIEAKQDAMFKEAMNEHGKYPLALARPLYPLPDDKILDRSKLKQIADDILKCI